MKNSRLIQLLRSFSNKDWRKMKQVVRSPLFNQRQDVIRFFDHINESMVLHSVIPTKEQIHRFVYNKKTYDAQETRQLMSFLYKIIEKYLVHQEVFEDDIDVNIKLATAYRKRNLPKAFHKTLKEIKVLQDQQPFRNIDFYQNNFFISQEENSFTASQKRLGEQNLQEVSDNLDFFFIAEKLRHACFSLSHQAVYKKDYQLGLLTETLAFVQQEKLLDIPAIALYYYAYYALEPSGNDQDFQVFKEKIFEQGHRFPAAEIRNLYLLAINYCIRRVNEREMSYFKEGLDLYKEGLKTKILLEDNNLPRFTFLNIVAMGLKVGDLKWVEQFIHQYQSNIKITYRQSYYKFSLARLAYARQEYEAALEHLRLQYFKDQLLQLAVKTIQLKIYFEMDEIELLEAHLEAMKMYIRRKKILGYHQSNYLNLIKFTKKIVTLNPFDEAAKKKLKEVIQSEGILTEKEWLLGQLG